MRGSSDIEHNLRLVTITSIINIGHNWSLYIFVLCVICLFLCIINEMDKGVSHFSSVNFETGDYISQMYFANILSCSAKTVRKWRALVSVSHWYIYMWYLYAYTLMTYLCNRFRCHSQMHHWINKCKHLFFQFLNGSPFVHA